MNIKVKIRKIIIGLLRSNDYTKLKKIHRHQYINFKYLVDKTNVDFILNSAKTDGLIHETWLEFSQKIYQQFLRRPSINFFGLPVFVDSMTGLHPYHDSAEFFKKIEIYFSQSELKDLLLEDLVGNPVLLRGSRYVTSLNRIMHLYQLALLIEASGGKGVINAATCITEWGGGYGGLARVIKKYSQNITYNIVDIPEVTLVQYFYLSSILGLDQVILHDGTDPIQKGKINLVPNSLLNSYKNQLQCDAFVSSWALSESSSDAQLLVNSIKFFNSNFGIVIYQPKSEKHPHSENILSMIHEHYDNVQQSAFPYWRDQTVIQFSKKCK